MKIAREKKKRKKKKNNNKKKTFEGRGFGGKRPKPSKIA